MSLVPGVECFMKNGKTECRLVDDGINQFFFFFFFPLIGEKLSPNFLIVHKKCYMKSGMR